MNDESLIWERYNLILNENLEGRMAEKNAREIFGSDPEPANRGYIYQNGEFLNLGDGQDHRSINSAYYPDEETGLSEIEVPRNNLGSSRLMIHFMANAGAVRWARTSTELILSYIQKLTGAQKRAITKIIDDYNISMISVDVYDSNYQTIKSERGEVWDDSIQRLL